MCYNLFGMKKTALICMVVAGALCIALCLLSSYYQMPILLQLGIGFIFSATFLILIIGVTVGFVRSYRHQGDLQDWSDPQTALTVKDSYSIAEYVFGRSVFGFRLAPKKAKVLSYLLLLFVILNFFCGMLLLFLHIIIPAVVCLCCFGITLFVCVLCAVLRFIFSLGKAIKKEEDEEAKIDREHAEILKKFENDEFEYNVATVINCTLLPPSENSADNEEKKWYEYVLEFGGRQHTVRHPDDCFEAGTRIVVYYIGDIIFISGSKSRKLQQQEE